MDAVLEDATIHQRRQTLHKMTNGLGLDDAYRTTLSRIKGLKGNKAKIGMQALMWISCCERLLKAQELCHALAVEVGTMDLNVHNIPSTRTLLSCTLGLVTIDEQESTTRLVHFTLQEHLTAHPNLFITTHSMMAEICLTYLHFRSICELPTTLDTIPSTTPFLHYASCHWGFHARKEMTEGVKHLAIRHLERDANHISADILLSEESVDFLSWMDRHDGRRPNLCGFTGLHCISYMGITEIAIDMVNMKRWDLNGRDSNGATPLIWAAKYGNLALMKLLLEQECVVPTISDRHGLTPLTHAAKAGQEGVLNLLFVRGDLNPDSPAEYGRTPLSYAAEEGRESVVKILLERGDVNPDSSDGFGLTPLSLAAGRGCAGVVRMLLERADVNPNSSDRLGWTPLLLVAGRGCADVVKVLLGRADVNPNSPDRSGRTPLSFAAQSGHGDVVKLLLEREDVYPNSPVGYDRTPLSYAAEEGHEGVVKILLEREDVNPDSSDILGQTPLSLAAGSGHEGVVKTLLGREDVNPDSSSKSGRTPLSYAAANFPYFAGSGHGGVVKILLERRDVNPNSPDWTGRTPLSYAAKSGAVDLVKMLLKHGDVNPNFCDKSGSTPLSYATGLGHEAVVNILLDRAEVNLDSSGDDRKPQLGPASQKRGVIYDAHHDVTEAIHFSQSNKPPPNQLEAPPSTSIPVPKLTSDAAPDLAISHPSRPLKRCRETQPLLYPSKRQNCPSS